MLPLNKTIQVDTLEDSGAIGDPLCIEMKRYFALNKTETPPKSQEFLP